jgi:hypothetical protein
MFCPGQETRARADTLMEELQAKLRYTVVTLLLHCCYTIVALLLNCCYTLMEELQAKLR